MSYWEEDRPSAAQRLLPPILLVLGIALAAWTVPALLRTADNERRSRVAEQAAERLASSTVLQDMNAAMRDIARATEPSVVHVSVDAEVRGRLGVREYTQSGSGWIWDTDGHVVTNAHVVDGAKRLEVQLNDGSLRPAELLGLDLRTDIAVLKVDSAMLHAAERSRDLPEQGDMVFAFGSPFEFRFSMSSGIVSGIGRSAGLAEVEYENFIQVDAAINPGNSGGPLVNVQGKVIGMNTAIATGRGSTIGSGQFAGIGLAIPMQIVENVVEQIIDHGAVAKGYLGVSVQDLANSKVLALRAGPDSVFATVAKEFHGQGALVSSVRQDGPAQKIGLRAGDVIVSIGGRRITRQEEVLSQIGTNRPGTKLPIEVWRANAGPPEVPGGAIVKLEAELGTLDPAITLQPLMEGLQGLGLEKLSDARQPVRGVRVDKVNPKSKLSDQLPEGSIITAVDGQSVASVDDLMVRMIRNASSRINVAAPSSVTLTLRLPSGTIREVDLLPRTPRETP